MVPVRLNLLHPSRPLPPSSFMQPCILSRRRTIKLSCEGKKKPTLRLSMPPVQSITLTSRNRPSTIVKNGHDAGRAPSSYFFFFACFESTHCSMPYFFSSSLILMRCKTTESFDFILRLLHASHRWSFVFLSEFLSSFGF